MEENGSRPAGSWLKQAKQYRDEDIRRRICNNLDFNEGISNEKCNNIKSAPDLLSDYCSR